MLKVDVSVIGRFHAFNLAYELQKKNYLNKLFTSLPKFRAQDFGINKHKVKTCLYCEIGIRCARKLRVTAKFPYINNLYFRCYMNALRQYVEKSDADIFIAFSGVSLDAIKVAKQRGMTVILERGSTHCKFQRNILTEEYNCQQMSNFSCINDEVYNREIEEYSLADFISIPSSFVKRTFISEGFSDKKLLVNPYGVDLSEFKQIKKVDNIFRVIYVGGLTFQKGSHYLLQAIYELRLPNIELWHIGTVSNDLKPFIQKFQSDKIKLFGHKPQNQLYKYYSQGSVFVMPSIQEGMAMVQLQAMACGLPLICTTNTGGDDLIAKDGEEGFVIPIRSVEAIKDRITYLYNNPNKLTEMGIKAKARVETGFTWEDYGNRYISNLDKIKTD